MVQSPKYPLWTSSDYGQLNPTLTANSQRGRE